jgi:hypothetical protein
LTILRRRLIRIQDFDCICLHRLLSYETVGLSDSDIRVLHKLPRQNVFAGFLSWSTPSIQYEVRLKWGRLAVPSRRVLAYRFRSKVEVLVMKKVSHRTAVPEET